MTVLSERLRNCKPSRGFNSLSSLSTTILRGLKNTIELTIVMLHSDDDMYHAAALMIAVPPKLCLSVNCEDLAQVSGLPHGTRQGEFEEI